MEKHIIKKQPLFLYCTVLLYMIFFREKKAIACSSELSQLLFSIDQIRSYKIRHRNKN